MPCFKDAAARGYGNRLGLGGRALSTLVAAVAFVLVAPGAALAETHPSIARCQEALKLQDIDAALQACDQAVHDVSTDQQKAQALQLRGLAWLGKYDLERALSDLNAAIALDASDAMVFSDREPPGH